jgi:DNA-binding beta-propeller fold protein YncE
MIDMHEGATGTRSGYNRKGKCPKWVRWAIVASGSIAFTVGVGAVSSAAVHERGAGLPRGGKVVARIVIPENSGVLAVGDGAVWTSTDTVSTLMRLDPKKNAVVARTKIRSHNACSELPGSCGEASVGSNALWIVREPDNAVLRIDPRSNSIVATIPVGPQPEGIATTPGAVWVVEKGKPSVSRIDPATSRVVATIRIGPRRACCSDHMAITAGGGAVWVSVPSLNAVVRIDPATNAVTARIRLSGQPCAFLAADERALWAAGGHCAPTVMRVDARTKKLSGRVNGLLAPIGLALGFGSLWIADLESKVIDRVNLRTARIVGRLPVGGYPVRLAVGFGSVWVRDDTGRVLRIKPLG